MSTNTNIFIDKIIYFAQNNEREEILSLLDTIPTDTNPVNRSGYYSHLLEQSGDIIFRTNPSVGLWLYEQAVEHLRIFASGASGQGDGRSRMAEVQTLLDKIAKRKGDF